MSEINNNGFFVALTNAGAALQTNAWQGGDKINLTDFNIGSDPSAISTSQTDVLAPVGERMKINMLKQKDDDAGVLEVVCVLPPEIGGWNMASIGLFTDTGILFAIANIPSDYKPVPTEGATKETTITMYISLGSTEKINLIIDPYKVIAMQDWVNNDSLPAKHMEDKENPHGVTITQIGAAAAGAFNTHTASEDNPHVVTFKQTLAASKMQEHQVMIPVGGIIMWSGALDAVPSGWALCNGANGTPDLRNRFVMGAGGKYAVGARGGAEVSTSSSTGAHAHSINIVSSADGGHSHKVDIDSKSVDNHAHTINLWSRDTTLTIAQIPAHTHGNVPLLKADIDRGNTSSGFSIDNASTTSSTGGSQGHRHMVAGAASESGAHNHNVNGDTSSVGHHQHRTAGGTSNTGAHTHTVNVLPPYYALAFIIKL